MIHRLLRVKKFIPTQFHNDVYEIDFKDLYNKGKRLVISDLDNTLISYDQYVPTKENLELFSKLKEIGYEVILLSNNVPKRISEYCKDIDIVGYANARKPLKIGIKKAFKNAKNEYSKDEVIFLGDQLMTDVYVASRFGVDSILVNPIKKKTEKWYTKMNRRIEEKMLKRIKNEHNDKYKDLKLDQRR